MEDWRQREAERFLRWLLWCLQEEAMLELYCDDGGNREKIFRKQNEQKRMNSLCGLESQAYVSLSHPSTIKMSLVT